MYRSFDDSQLWALTRLSGRVKQNILVHECKFTPKYFTGWSMNELMLRDGMKNCDGVSLLMVQMPSICCAVAPCGLPHI